MGKASAGSALSACPPRDHIGYPFCHPRDPTDFPTTIHSLCTILPASSHHSAFCPHTVKLYYRSTSRPTYKGKNKRLFQLALTTLNNKTKPKTTLRALKSAIQNVLHWAICPCHTRLLLSHSLTNSQKLPQKLPQLTHMPSPGILTGLGWAGLHSLCTGFVHF